MRNVTYLASAGTERVVVDFTAKNLVQQVLARSNLMMYTSEAPELRAEAQAINRQLIAARN